MSMTPVRSCDGCRACCHIFAIDVPGLSKPANTPCQHLTGTGCGIYAQRPPVCSGYRCAWLDGVGEWRDKPDRSGWLMDIDPAYPGRPPYIRLIRLRNDAAPLPPKGLRAAAARHLADGWIVQVQQPPGISGSPVAAAVDGSEESRRRAWEVATAWDCIPMTDITQLWRTCVVEAGGDVPEMNANAITATHVFWTAVLGAERYRQTLQQTHDAVAAMSPEDQGRFFDRIQHQWDERAARLAEEEVKS